MNENWSTSDIYLAVFLACNDYDYEVIAKNKKQCLFKFIKDENLDKIIKDYYNNKEVNVLTYKDKLRNIKSEINNVIPRFED